MEKNETAKQAIRNKCLQCCNGQANEVKLCPVTDCELYPFRMGVEQQIDDRERVCRSKAIKQYCNQCGEEPRAKCTFTNCALYNHR